MKTALACLLFSTIFTAVAAGEQSAVLLQPNSRDVVYDGDGPFTMGFYFSVDQPISVTAFGVFDQGSDGLQVAHQVGIWTLDGTPVYVATVPVGASASLIDRFRYVAIPPLSLHVGGHYIIGAGNVGQSGDGYLIKKSGVPQSSPRITLKDSFYAYTPGGDLAFPTRQEFYGFPTLFGANFRWVPVPEPSGLLLLSIAIVGTLQARRNRRRPRTGPPLIVAMFQPASRT